MSTHGSLFGDQRHKPEIAGPFSRGLYDTLTLKATARRADAVVVSSEVEYEEALEFGIHRDKLHIIPDGITVPPQTTDRSNRQGGPMNLLFAGPLTRNRRPELLLRAARKLTLPFRITLLATNDILENDGSAAYLADLKKLVKTLGIEDRVDICSDPSPEDINRCYSQADVFIYPSTYEVSGETLLEAGASGLPIISTPVGVANEVVSSGENGFIVPADPDMICDRILQLTDPETRHRFGRASREKIINHSGWSSVMDRTVELYRSLLA